MGGKSRDGACADFVLCVFPLRCQLFGIMMVSSEGALDAGDDDHCN